jgi:hypothetical protein
VDALQIWFHEGPNSEAYTTCSATRGEDPACSVSIPAAKVALGGTDHGVYINTTMGGLTCGQVRTRVGTRDDCALRHFLAASHAQGSELLRGARKFLKSVLKHANGAEYSFMDAAQRHWQRRSKWHPKKQHATQLQSEDLIIDFMEEG